MLLKQRHMLERGCMKNKAWRMNREDFIEQVPIENATKNALRSRIGFSQSKCPLQLEETALRRVQQHQRPRFQLGQSQRKRGANRAAGARDKDALIPQRGEHCRGRGRQRRSRQELAPVDGSAGCSHVRSIEGRARVPFRVPFLGRAVWETLRAGGDPIPRHPQIASMHLDTDLIADFHCSVGGP